jgi:hypothetical protein
VEESITISFLPTPLVELALSETWPETTNLRLLMTGGDMLRTAPPAGMPFTVVNVYGPTEYTVITTVARLINGSTDTPPIGRGIANTQVYLLNERLAPTPIGVKGELYIGGEGLARGYWGRPDLTAERFLPNPFREDGERIYKTGDWVRYKTDASIEYLGRMDNQVKIRGHRIEIGEVEFALRECEGVKEAVVMLRETRGAEKQLVAYVVKKEGEEGGAESWRRALRRKLPEYMAPGAFVELDALPLTPNGKIDRRALPDPGNDRAITEVPFIPPRTNLEEEIARLWRDALQLNDIGVHDNFFDLGGHSLLLVKVRDRICNDLHKQVSMIDLFQYPTISLLADLLSHTQNGAPLLDVSEGRADARSRSLRNRRALRGTLRDGVKAEQEPS